MFKSMTYLTWHLLLPEIQSEKPASILKKIAFKSFAFLLFRWQKIEKKYFVRLCEQAKRNF